MLKRGNSQHRGKLRRHEKNARIAPEVRQSLELWRDRWRRLYLNAGSCVAGGGSELAEFANLVRLARFGEEPLTPQEVLEGKVAIAAGTLYHLIRAIPQLERDDQEIYPGDFRTTHIPQPLRTNWNARQFYRWWLYDWRGRYRKKKETFGLSDYSEPVRLLLYGRYWTEHRQQAAPVIDVLLARSSSAPTSRSTILKAQDHGLDPHWDMIWRDCDIRLSLYALGQLKSPDEQWLLLRVGRLYKGACYWPKRDSASLFDRCGGGHLKDLKKTKPKLIAPASDHVLQDPKKQEVADYWQQKEGRPQRGGEVSVRIPGTWPWHVPAKRYAQLAATQESDNKKWCSYLNGVNLSRAMRGARTLNIEPRIETPQVMRQATEDNKCPTFTNYLMTKSQEKPCSPLPPASLKPPPRTLRRA